MSVMTPKIAKYYHRQGGYLTVSTQRMPLPKRKPFNITLPIWLFALILVLAGMGIGAVLVWSGLV